MDWTEIDRPEWERHAATAPLQQTWRWGSVLAESGARIERRAMCDSGQVRALVQVATRRFGPVAVSLVSRGPVGIEEDEPKRGLARLAATLRPAGLRILLVTPDSVGPRAGVPMVTPVHHAELDISRPLDDLRGGLHPKMRGNLARGEGAGLVVRREDTAPKRYAWLLETEARQQRERRYRNWPPAMVNLWHAKGGAVRVFVAYSGGIRVAAMLFLLHGRVATYHIGWAGEEGRRMSAHPLCLWRAVRHLQSAGIERIDLGSVNTEDAPGLARFKLATGATVRPLGPTCLVPPRWLTRFGA